MASKLMVLATNIRALTGAEAGPGTRASPMRLWGALRRIRVSWTKQWGRCAKWGVSQERRGAPVNRLATMPKKHGRRAHATK